MSNFKSRTPYRLASHAGCMSPDSETSPGAVWLRNVAEDLDETVKYAVENDELADLLADPSDLAHEIADRGVPIYTRDVWAVFTDLAAYQEDPTELGFDGTDMERGAKTCLYIIAERLVLDLLASGEDEEEVR